MAVNAVTAASHPSSVPNDSMIPPLPRRGFRARVASTSLTLERWWWLRGLRSAHAWPWRRGAVEQLLERHGIDERIGLDPAVVEDDRPRELVRGARDALRQLGVGR